MTAEHPLSRRIAAVLALDPRAGAIEFDGQWISWGQSAASAAHIAAVADDPHGHNASGRDAAAQPARTCGRPARRADRRRIRRRHQPRPRRRPHQGRHRRARCAGHPRRARRSRRHGRLCRSVGRGGAHRRHAGPQRDRRSRAADRPGGTARGRGADADQRHHRPAQAHRPHLRHAGSQRAGSGTRGLAAADRTAPRRRDRQRAAGAHRRGVPGAAVRRPRQGPSCCSTDST